MNWAHYIIQVNIYLVVFYGFYKLLLDKETYFSLNRIYLIAAGSLSLAIPFLRFEWFATQQAAQPVYISVDQLNQFVTRVIVAPKAADQFSLANFLVMLYLTGVVLFFCRLAYQLYMVRGMMRKRSKGAAFSFFSKQFVDDQLPGSRTISKHEEIHVRQLHSADVLFFEVLAALTWFNPIVYFYKTSIKNIHEYLADEEAARFQGNKDQYAMLLMSNALGVAPSTLINSFFNQSLLKKRIYMLYKQRSRKVAILKYGLFVPLFAVTLVASSATIRNNEQIREFAAEIPLEKPIDAVKEAVQQVIIEPSANVLRDAVSTAAPTLAESLNGETAAADWQKFYLHIQRTIRYSALAMENKLTGKTQIKFTVKDGQIEGTALAGPALGDGCDAEVMRSILAFPDFKSIADGNYVLRISFTLSDEGNTEYVVKNKDLPAVAGYEMLNEVVIRGYARKAGEGQAATPLNQVNIKPDNGEKVHDFTSLDTQPTFPGGMQKFYEYISKTVKYPKEAQEKNIQGKVFVSFVVETDGTLSDITIERKLSPELDEEALRILKLSPKWVPGTAEGHAVRVKYNIPLSFSLSKPANLAPVNVETLLQGKVQGLRIDSNAKAPNMRGSVNIRGLTSTNLNTGETIQYPTSPLYVIDGVKQPKADTENHISILSTIPQDNIASIEILKDETAKALYGDDAAYGVILITTINKNNPAIKTIKTTKPAASKEVTIKTTPKPVKKTN